MRGADLIPRKRWEFRVGWDLGLRFARSSVGVSPPISARPAWDQLRASISNLPSSPVWDIQNNKIFLFLPSILKEEINYYTEKCGTAWKRESIRGKNMEEFLERLFLKTFIPTEEKFDLIKLFFIIN